MRTAAQLQELVTQYRQLCQEIEWVKHRIVGGSYPVECRRWKSWKAKQARKRHLDLDYVPLAELSDDPHYQQLLKLKEQISTVWFEIGDMDEYEKEEAFLRDVTMSFPSLRKLITPGFPEVGLANILCDGEVAHPQAYHAALFVNTLQSVGRSRHKSAPTFFIDRAFEVWDDEHKEAFARWLGTPCFPGDDFRRLSVDPPSV